MKKYNYPGFDRLEEDSELFLSLPLCDILYSFLGARDFDYISAALFPLELTELILHYLKYKNGVAQIEIDDFSDNYLTEDSLYPIDKLLTLWGVEKFKKMIVELKMLSDN